MHKLTLVDRAFTIIGLLTIATSLQDPELAKAMRAAPAVHIAAVQPIAIVDDDILNLLQLGTMGCETGD
jgi:hypothetical protein